MGAVTEVEWKDRAIGDVGALHGVGLISDEIIEGERLAGEIVEGSTFEASHIYVVSDKHIFEAIFPKISLSPWSVYDGQLTRLWRFNVPAANKLAALLALQAKWVGQHYDLVGVLNMGFLEIERHFAGHDIERNALASAHRRWCSELGTDFIASIYPQDAAVDRGTDPQQVVNYLTGLEGAA